MNPFFIVKCNNFRYRVLSNIEFDSVFYMYCFDFKLDVFELVEKISL